MINAPQDGAKRYEIGWERTLGLSSHPRVHEVHSKTDLGLKYSQCMHAGVTRTCAGLDVKTLPYYSETKSPTERT